MQAYINGRAAVFGYDQTDRHRKNGLNGNDRLLTTACFSYHTSITFTETNLT